MSVGLRGKPSWRHKSGNAPEASESTVPALSSGDRVVGVVTGGRDVRAVAGLQDSIEETALRARTVTVLEQAKVNIDDETLDLVVSQVRRANEKMEDAFDSLVETGRMLNRIQLKLGEGGYKALFEASIFTIGLSMASKLRRIASLMEGIPADMLPKVPRNLSGAYMIASLPQAEIESTMKVLIAEDLVPNASIRRLESGLKRIRHGEPDQLAGMTALLIRKRAARKTLDTEIVTLERQIAALRKDVVN
jgi:hypothetical protein